jgi:tetratricopeptide (TPR) repeat protein
VLPRGVRYEGRVHEQPAYAGPRRRLDLTVGHDGYLPDVLDTKRGRNAALLERALAESPDDGYLLLQLGRAYEADRRHADAAAVYERARHHVPASAPARHDLVVRSMFCLGQAGDTAAALRLAEDEMPHWADSPDFHFCLGDLLLEHGLAHPDDAPGVVPLIESSWQHCLELGERPELVGAVHGRGSFLAAHNLATLYDAVGDPARAASYRALAVR